MFKLDERLSCCAGFVREGTALADIGTDHGYLPIWLALQGKIRKGTAGDIRVGPLQNAAGNIARYHVEDKVTTVLSDGLAQIPPEDAEDIVMAGMGAELMIRLIDSTPWLREGQRQLILQPMTRAWELRRYLCENGFAILQERACISLGKSYSVLLCRYDGCQRECSDRYAYIGSLGDQNTPEAERYIRSVISRLTKTRKGCPPGSEDARRLTELIEELTQLVEGSEVE